MRLTKNIAIFYEDFEWGKVLFNKIMNNVPLEWISYLRKNEKDGVYELGYGKNNNQSTIFMRKANINIGRCRRFDEVYIQDIVDSRIKKEVLMPLLTQKTMHVLSTRDIEDMI